MFGLLAVCSFFSAVLEFQYSFYFDISSCVLVLWTFVRLLSQLLYYRGKLYKLSQRWEGLYLLFTYISSSSEYACSYLLEDGWSSLSSLSISLSPWYLYLEASLSYLLSSEWVAKYFSVFENFGTPLEFELVSNMTKFPEAFYPKCPVSSSSHNTICFHLTFISFLRVLEL